MVAEGEVEGGQFERQREAGGAEGCLHDSPVVSKQYERQPLPGGAMRTKASVGYATSEWIQVACSLHPPRHRLECFR